MKINFIIIFGFLFAALGCQSQPESKKKKIEMVQIQEEGLDTAIFGAGCFWCVEAVFQRIDGVEKVISGYSGGFIKNPPYREVCEGTTGHQKFAC